VSQQIEGSTAEGAAVADPALDAVRALIAATARPVGVFAADGTCLTANRAFVLRATRHARAPNPPAGSEGRTSFSPDGVRTWTLVSVPEEGAEPAVADFLDTVANALPVMFNAKDTQSRYLFMNRYQAELYGVATDAAVGHTADDLLGEEYGAYTRAIDAEVIRSGRATPFFEESYAGVDGVPRHWLTSKVPLANEAGTVWGVATVSIDITVRTQLEDGLRQAKQQAEDANRAKSGFLAAMSHELRTPLNAVIGFAEIMHQQVLGPIGTPEYRDYAGHILRSGQHLLALINDVLDYARIESGSLRLNLVTVDVRGLLRGTLELLGETAAAAGVTLATDLTEQRIVIRADEQRLRQVLLNVAGNAVKFTPAGGRVAVALEPGPAGGAVISVTDSGIGIDAAQMAHAFEPFWQADSGLDRVKEGAGIGLPLARQLVALHGGRLELQSRVGEGTRITIELPESPGEATQGR
jgi:PAS domain S-box-containing protein